MSPSVNMVPPMAKPTIRLEATKQKYGRPAKANGAKLAKKS